MAVRNLAVDAKMLDAVMSRAAVVKMLDAVAMRAAVRPAAVTAVVALAIAWATAASATLGR